MILANSHFESRNFQHINNLLQAVRNVGVGMGTAFSEGFNLGRCAFNSQYFHIQKSKQQRHHRVD